MPPPRALPWLHIQLITNRYAIDHSHVPMNLLLEFQLYHSILPELCAYLILSQWNLLKVILCCQEDAYLFS